MKARPGLSNTNLNKLFGPNYKQQPLKDIPKVNYNQKVLHSAFSPPPGASNTEKLKVNLKSIGNAGLVANQKAMEAMKMQQSLLVQQSAPIIDPYFQQFTPETCVEHPGNYHQMYKTSTGFTASAKIAPQQVKSCEINLEHSIIENYRNIDSYTDWRLITHFTNVQDKVYVNIFRQK